MTAKFYISNSYQKDLLSKDTRFFTPSIKPKNHYTSILFILIIVLALLLICHPTTAVASNYYIAETCQDSVLRSEPSKNASVLTTLPANTLVCITGSVTNSKGNIWFCVNYFDQEAYCYSENLVEHIHSFTIPIENGYVCKCNAIESNPDGVEPTFVPAIVAGEYGIAAVGALAAVTYVGLRHLSDCIVPVIVNSAGVLESITMDALRSMTSSQSSGGDYSRRVYYPATIILGDKNDSVELIDVTKPLNLDEACDFIDNILRMNGSFGNFSRFSSQQTSLCNIYTFDISDAEMLASKVISCQGNSINQYGNSSGTAVFELNSGEKLNGTYKHFHIFNAFDAKSVVHILFGEPLSLYESNWVTF